MPPVTKMLAESAPRWSAELGSVVEGIVQALIHTDAKPQSSATNRRLPTPVTQANRSADRAKVRQRERRTASSPFPKVPAACLDCGTILDDSARRYCEDCWPKMRQEQGTAFAVAGPAELAKRRAAEIDPAHGGTAGKARGRRNANHHHANAAWIGDNDDGQDAERFTSDSLPRLQGVSLRNVAGATGLTEGHCSFIRRGIKIPRRRHWRSLATLAVESDT